MVECSPPPFQSDNIKYVVGTPVTTVINLLDWDESEGPSPLATSQGWVNVEDNEFVTVAGTDPDSGIPYTTNGLPMTNDFDLAVYVKGDRKSTAVYNAQLVIEYAGEVPEPPTDFDLALSELNVPDRVLLGESSSATVVVTNSGPANVLGAVVTLTGVTNRGDTISVTPDSETLGLLTSGDSETVTFEWTASDGKPATISWTAVVTSDGDTNPVNDTATASTQVRRN